MPVTVDDSPAALSSVLGAGIGLLGAVTAGLYAPLALAASAVGFVSLAAGLLVGRPTLISLGAVGILVGAMLAGWVGASPAVVVFAVAAAILSWDLARFAVGLGEQLGSEATTVRLELVHAVASIGVGVGAILLGAVAFAVAGGSASSTGLAVLVAAVILGVVALRRIAPDVGLPGR